MPAPDAYDPTSENEQAPALPSAPLVGLSENIVLQPALTRRGTGPGLIIFLPATSSFAPSTKAEKPLDPEPVQKWAEEGFNVVGLVGAAGGLGWNVEDGLVKGVNALLELKELDTKDKFGVIVYDPQVLSTVVGTIGMHPRLAGVVSFGSPLIAPPVPALVHAPKNAYVPQRQAQVDFAVHQYSSESPFFVLPKAADYDGGLASQAHSRSLVFLRKILGGPHFDLEAIWDEHTFFEFEQRSVAKTMATMVAEPYVNHVPTMTGGIGRKALTAFYRDHFIFANPEDTELQPVSRTVGSDRVVDEFIFKLTHDRIVDWLLPGVPPTGKYLQIPMLGVINIRGDRLYHEHIWWDQGTVLKQAGILPEEVPWNGGSQKLRLPVAGAESARLLVDETDGKSNEMLAWGLSNA